MASLTQILANLGSLLFDNSSDGAVVPQIAQGVSLVVDTTILEIGNTRAGILADITLKNYGKSGYYTGIALAFQDGYNLVIDPVTLANVYAVIDPSVQVVKQAAFVALASGNDVQLFLKIATQDPVTGLLQPLTAAQLSSFTTYFSLFLIPYIPVTIINGQPNVLNFNAACAYYATYDLPTLQGLVNAQLTLFLTSFNFNGVFYAGDLEDFVKYGSADGTVPGVPGVRNFRLSNTSLDGGPFSGMITLPSGYFNYMSNIDANISYNIAT